MCVGGGLFFSWVSKSCPHPKVVCIIGQGPWFAVRTTGLWIRQGALLLPGTESWCYPSPDPSTSCQADAHVPGGGAQVLPARDPASTFLLIASFLGRTGQDRVDFGLAEPHTVLFHEPGSSSVWVGGRGRVYLFDFPEGKNASMRTVSLEPSASPRDTVSPSLPLTHLSFYLLSGLGERPQGIWGAGISS